MADLEALLNEISSDEPSGGNLEYDPAYMELVKDIQGKPEDPISGEKAQPPNWRDIQKSASALLQRSKDLQIAVYLARALIPLEGMPGFRDGVRLIVGLVETYWDTIHPILDPEDNFDPTARINILEELSNFESVLRPLQNAPLAESKGVGRFSLRDIQIATEKIAPPEGEEKPDLNAIKAAFQDMAPEALQALHQAVTDSLDCASRLEATVNEKVGIGNGADFSGLSALLREMKSAYSQYSPIDEINTISDLSEESGQSEALAMQGEGSARKAAGGLGAINTRQDVVKALDLICKYYAESEPSSPVPILLQRAKLLATADFMTIVQNLLPDSVSQLQFYIGPDTEQF